MLGREDEDAQRGDGQEMGKRKGEEEEGGVRVRGATKLENEQRQRNKEQEQIGMWVVSF